MRSYAAVNGLYRLIGVIEKNRGAVVVVYLYHAV